MAFQDDNTGLIRMKRDFDHFIQDHSRSAGLSSFNLDESTDVSFKNTSNDTGAISIQALLEREKAAKMKEAEMISVKSQMLKLETKLNSLETSNKRARIEFDHEIESLQSEKNRESMKLADLKAQMKFITSKEQKARDELAEYQKKADEQRKKLEEKVLSLQKEKFQLTDDLEKGREENWEQVTEMKKELMRRDTELKICQTELEETKTQLKLQLKRSSEITNQMRDQEEYKLKAAEAEQRIKDLELQVSRMEEDNVIANAMKTQVTTFQEMEKENRKLVKDNEYLRQTQENILLLKEENQSMKKKMERYEDNMAEMAKAQLENENLKVRLEKWEKADKSGPRISSPAELSKRVSELQTSQAIMLSKQGELNTSLHSREEELRSRQSEISSLNEQLNTERIKQQQHADFIKRLQRKLLLVTKERDGYKRIIDSYESEVTVNISAGSLDRVQHLEENIKAYKKQTEILEAELNKVNDEVSASKHYCKQLELKVKELQVVHNGVSVSQTDQQNLLHLREKIADLEKALEKCEKEKYNLECLLEQRHLQGDYDPSKVKVLHFKMNPADIAATQRKEELKRLQEENDRLRQRVKLLEESEGKIEDLTVVVEKKLQEPGGSKDVEEMKAQLMSAELKNKRLMEAFKKTSQEIREVCYQLTGYKIDIPTSNQYRLTSMYAESPNDHLLFQQQSGGEMNMLETEFSRTIQDLIQMYLVQQDSIPAFLSGLTLELCSRQTMTFR